MLSAAVLVLSAAVLVIGRELDSSRSCNYRFARRLIEQERTEITEAWLRVTPSRPFARPTSPAARWRWLDINWLFFPVLQPECVFFDCDFAVSILVRLGGAHQHFFPLRWC